MPRTEITTPSHPLTDHAQSHRWPVLAIAVAVAVAVATVPAVLGDTIVSLIARQIGGVSGKFTPMQPAAYVALAVAGLRRISEPGRIGFPRRAGKALPTNASAAKRRPVMTRKAQPDQAPEAARRQAMARLGGRLVAADGAVITTGGWPEEGLS